MDKSRPSRGDRKQLEDSSEDESPSPGSSRKSVSPSPATATSATRLFKNDSFLRKPPSNLPLNAPFHELVREGTLEKIQTRLQVKFAVFLILSTI